MQRRRHLSSESPLLGGPLPSGAGAEEPRGRAVAYDEDADVYLLPDAHPRREVDDWGRSERVFRSLEPMLNFYYRYWFRCEVEGIENIPSAGGALLSSNHSGALPPDAPMIMQAIRNEHSAPRPL